MFVCNIDKKVGVEMPRITIKAHLITALLAILVFISLRKYFLADLKFEANRGQTYSEILKAKNGKLVHIHKAFNEYIKSTDIKLNNLRSQLDSIKFETLLLKQPEEYSIEADQFWTKTNNTMMNYFKTLDILNDKSNGLRIEREKRKTSNYIRIRSSMVLGIMTINNFNESYKSSNVFNWTISNQKKYAKKWGYLHNIENGISDPKRDANWSKYTSMLRHFEDDLNDWILYIDVNSLFMKSSIKAEDFIDNSYDIILPQNSSDYTSCFIVRNSEFGKMFLKKIIQSNYDISSDNLAMKVLL